MSWQQITEEAQVELANAEDAMHVHGRQERAVVTLAFAGVKALLAINAGLESIWQQMTYQDRHR